MTRPKGLSRLKGIETRVRHPGMWDAMLSERAFPFEGNWNAFSIVSTVVPLIIFVRKGFPVWRELKLQGICVSDTQKWIKSERAFPFEGNWNSFCSFGASTICTFVRKGFPVWRELKRRCRLQLRKRVWTGPKGLSRLKGIETQPLRRPMYRPLSRPKGLSRLKGMETLFQCDECCLFAFVSERAFPFEGNWNASSRVFPNSQDWSERAFPFEGNWNGCATISLSAPVASWSERAFPFEGNWNRLFQVPKQYHPNLSPKGLSRLKGMETACGWA